MVRLARVDDECGRCNSDDVDTATHTIHFGDDRPPITTDVCATCVRRLRRQENDVTAIF